MNYQMTEREIDYQAAYSYLPPPNRSRIWKGKRVGVVSLIWSYDNKGCSMQTDNGTFPSISYRYNPGNRCSQESILFGKTPSELPWIKQQLKKKWK